MSLATCALRRGAASSMREVSAIQPLITTALTRPDKIRTQQSYLILSYATTKTLHSFATRHTFVELAQGITAHISAPSRSLGSLRHDSRKRTISSKRPRPALTDRWPTVVIDADAPAPAVRLPLDPAPAHPRPCPFSQESGARLDLQARSSFPCISHNAWPSEAEPSLMSILRIL